MQKVTYGEVSWERMIRAVERVRERLRRAVAALEKRGVPYAVAGGNAVAAWGSRVDEAAVRNTQEIDILLRRSDLSAAIEAMTRAGFVYRHTASLDNLIEVGLVDASWCTYFSTELAARLQQLLDNPEG